MIEARINTKTRNKQLRKLIQGSGSAIRDPGRLAFALIPKGMNGHCKGQHTRQALRESPVEGHSVVNKVHVQWDPAVKFEGDKPRMGANSVPFLFEKIPFHGYRVDGTKIGKGEK